MKKLKIKSFKSVLPILLVLWIGAGYIAYNVFPSLMNALKEPIPWDSVDFSSDIEGLYVTGTVYGIYDCYCEERKNGKVLNREYLIDADDYYYMGLRAENKDMTSANALMEASYVYLDGDDDGTLLEQKQYEVTGIIKSLPSDSLALYHEYLDWPTLDDESKTLFLPYYIDVNKVGRYSKTETIVLTVTSFILFVLGALFLFWVITGKYQKAIKKYISSSSSPDMARERIENFLNSIPEVNGLRYNQNFICGQEKGTTAFGEIQNLAWIYLQTTTHKRNFITISTTYSLVFGFADGTRQSAQVKNEAIAKEHMEKLSTLCPKAIFGYSNDLDKMFRKNLPEFLNLRYNNTSSFDGASLSS